MEKTLLILAAGMGSRFGGLKQIEPVGPNGEFIIDYSIYDAIRCGFTKVVIVIKEENYTFFKETIGKRFEDKIRVEYVFQNLNNIPTGYNIPKDRVKPLGTAHAILCAKSVINEPFTIINADDFYGNDAYRVVSEFLERGNTKEKEHYALVGYNVLNTLTKHGAVKRGVCEVDCDEKLVKIDESSIELCNGIINSKSLVTGCERILNSDTIVSMNMIAFNPSVFYYIEQRFKEFLNSADLINDEFLIPEVLEHAISDNYCDVRVLSTSAKWVGVTYKEDKDEVVEYINELLRNGEYK